MQLFAIKCYRPQNVQHVVDFMLSTPHVVKYDKETLVVYLQLNFIIGNGHNGLAKNRLLMVMKNEGR